MMEMVVYTHNYCTWESEAGGLQVPGQLHVRLYLKNKTTNKRNKIIKSHIYTKPNNSRTTSHQTTKLKKKSRKEKLTLPNPWLS